MTMNWKLTGLAVALLAVCPALASAVDGVPSQATLSAMGLSGMEIMSDEEGMAVRGQGFTFAGGLSWAQIGGGFPNAASVNVSFAGGDYWSSQTNGSSADKLEVNVSNVVVYPDGTIAITGNASYKRYTASGYSSAKAF